MWLIINYVASCNYYTQSSRYAVISVCSPASQYAVISVCSHLSMQSSQYAVISVCSHLSMQSSAMLYAVICNAVCSHQATSNVYTEIKDSMNKGAGKQLLVYKRFINLACSVCTEKYRTEQVRLIKSLFYGIRHLHLEQTRNGYNCVVWSKKTENTNIFLLFY